MNKYNNSVVYKIYCKDPNVKEIYIGSTVDFKRRISEHKRRWYNENSREYNHFIYQFIRQNGGWDCFNMEIVEECNVNDKKALLERERFYILQNENKLNKQIVGRTQKEYYENNKDNIIKYAKQRYENNTELILERNKQYREKNKDKIKQQQKEYYETNKEQILEINKQYREKNKDKIKQQKKEYIEANKHKIQEKMKQKFTCACGSDYTYGHKARHERTTKHQQYIHSII
jgi:molecular chaperone DnaK (HSP70)